MGNINQDFYLSLNKQRFREYGVWKVLEPLFRQNEIEKPVFNKILLDFNCCTSSELFISLALDYFADEKIITGNVKEVVLTACKSLYDVEPRVFSLPRMMYSGAKLRAARVSFDLCNMKPIIASACEIAQTSGELYQPYRVELFRHYYVSGFMDLFSDDAIAKSGGIDLIYLAGYQAGCQWESEAMQQDESKKGCDYGDGNF